MQFYFSLNAAVPSKSEHESLNAICFSKYTASYKT